MPIRCGCGASRSGLGRIAIIHPCICIAAIASTMAPGRASVQSPNEPPPIIVSLPMYSGVAHTDVMRVVDAIRDLAR